MIKFTQRQLNTIIDACGAFYYYKKQLDKYQTVANMNMLQNYGQYMRGVEDALDISIMPNKDGNDEIFHVYPAGIASLSCARDYKNNKIEVLTVDAEKNKVIYELSKDTSEYGKKYFTQLRDGLITLYKIAYNEEISI